MKGWRYWPCADARRMGLVTSPLGGVPRPAQFFTPEEAKARAQQDVA